MSTTTTNLGLIKPELTDSADITQMNQNWDKLDEKVGTLKLQTYVSLADIGLTNGDETITSIVSNLPEDSQLFTLIDSSCAKIYPTQYGVLYVHKKNSSRTYFEFFEKTNGKRYYGVYDSSATPSWQDWNLMYTNKHKPSADDVGALPLSGGVMTGQSFYLNNKTGRIVGNQNGMWLRTASSDVDNNADSRHLKLWNATYQTDLSKALALFDTTTGQDYLIYGQHNKPTPANIGAAPAYTYGTEDIEAGSASPYPTGHLHFIYE